MISFKTQLDIVSFKTTALKCFPSKPQLWNGFLQNSALEWFALKLSFGMVSSKTRFWNGFLQNSTLECFLQNSALEWFPSKLRFVLLQNSAYERFPSELGFKMVPSKLLLEMVSFKTHPWNGFL